MRLPDISTILIGKAIRSNMQSVFTDCPHREKLGWLEQVHLNGPGLLYNYDGFDIDFEPNFGYSGNLSGNFLG